MGVYDVTLCYWCYSDTVTIPPVVPATTQGPTRGTRATHTAYLSPCAQTVSCPITGITGHRLCVGTSSAGFFPRLLGRSRRVAAARLLAAALGGRRRVAVDGAVRAALVGGGVLHGESKGPSYLLLLLEVDIVLAGHEAQPKGVDVGVGVGATDSVSVEPVRECGPLGEGRRSQSRTCRPGRPDPPGTRLAGERCRVPSWRGYAPWSRCTGRGVRRATGR